VQALPPASGSSLHARAGYFWSGLTSQPLTLVARTSLSVPLQVGFPRAGIFTIDRFQVTVSPSSSHESEHYVLQSEEHNMIDVQAMV
jgi:hypothetical protein